MAGEIDDALERASHDLFTRHPPKTPLAQIRLLTKAEKGNTAAVAARLGVSRRTVERYLAGQRKHPGAALRDALTREVAKIWQPRVRARRRRKAATTTGITIETRARFGYTAPIGTTDDPRLRRLTIHLPPEHAARLLKAQDQRASDQQLREILAQGIQQVYFQDHGRRAQDLDVELTDIAYLDVAFPE